MGSEMCIRDRGSTVEQIKAAIDGCRASAFHMGENDAGKKHDDLTLICRSGAKLDWFRQKSIPGGNGKRDGPQPHRAAFTAGEPYTGPRRSDEEAMALTAELLAASRAGKVTK